MSNKFDEIRKKMENLSTEQKAAPSNQNLNRRELTQRTQSDAGMARGGLGIVSRTLQAERAAKRAKDFALQLEQDAELARQLEKEERVPIATNKSTRKALEQELKTEHAARLAAESENERLTLAFLLKEKEEEAARLAAESENEKLTLEFLRKEAEDVAQQLDAVEPVEPVRRVLK